MANNYQFLDAYSSVKTAAALDVGGAYQPFVQIQGSVVTVGTAATNQSVSGTVIANQGGAWTTSVVGGVSILGGTVSLAPTSVATLQGTNPWIVQLTSGSIATSGGTTGNSSVMLTQGTNTIGSVTALQGTNPWITLITGSVATVGGGAGTQYTEGSVSGALTGTGIIFRGSDSTSVLTTVSPNNPLPITVTPGTRISSISGTVTIAGSVAALQGTNPWVIGNSSVMLTAGINAFGSVATLQGTNPWIVNSTGSVLATLSSSNSSVIALNTVTRNDAVASFLGADLTSRYMASDSAGRVLVRPFAPEESRVAGYMSVNGTSVTTAIAAAGTGLRNYITDVQVANTGSVATLVTFQDGAASVIGYTIAPATGGSNVIGMATPMRTGANASFDFVAKTASSTLYVTATGYKAP